MGLGVIKFFLLLSLSSFGASPLSPTILMFNFEDAQFCPQRVDRAIEAGEKHLLFLPTLYFVADENDRLLRYCSMEGGHCVKFTLEKISRYENLWRDCFQKTLGKGITVSVLPHIDDGGPTADAWRNEIIFDPLTKYEGFSYDDIMLSPLERALSLSDKIDITLEGEMGATIFSFPDSYIQIFKRLKKSHPHWNMGLSFNFNDVDGRAKNKYPSLTQLLFAVTDYIGLSAYHSVHIPVTPEDFEANISDFKGQLLSLGVTVPANKVFQFSEVGVGGANREGSGPAHTPEESADNPWSGITDSEYSPSNDPWTNPIMKAYRGQFYNSLLSFLNEDVNFNHVAAAYTWNILSWDVEGFESPEYGDKDITRMIKLHNSALP